MFLGAIEETSGIKWVSLALSKCHDCKNCYKNWNLTYNRMLFVENESDNNF